MQQNITTGVQNLDLNSDKTPLMSAPQASPAPAEQAQPPPPGFLSGIPMVNPNNYPSNNTQEHVSPPDQQQPFSQAQSMVSNVAAYSSSKFSLISFILLL